MRRTIFNYFEGKLSKEESEKLFEEIQRSPKAKREYLEIKNFQAFRNAATKRINGFPYKQKERRFRILYTVAGVCSCLIILLIFNNLHISNREKSALTQMAAISDSINNAAKRAGSAVLQLASGEELQIENNSAEIKNIDEFVRQNSLEAVTDGKKANPQIAAKKLNTIKVTSKNDYLLTLYDGTKVWLKKDARISFPDKFDSDRRYVELDGEAYFSVAKNPLSPFVIKTNSAQVTVLGTEFNLDTKSKEFVLSIVSGKVAVATEGREDMTLTKNQQLTIDKSGQYSVEEFDCFIYKAWTQGYFLFINRTLPSILKQLGEWYEVDIELQSSKYDKELFNGKYNITKGFDELIKTLQMSYNFTFYMKDGKLYIE